MARNENFEGLILKGVMPLNCKELGRGAYGKVYKVEYCELVCAAKELHSILVEGVNEDERRRIVQSFVKECHQCSKLRHPNIVQFMGVYYPSQMNDAGINQLPVMVMEMMSNSLTKFVEEYHEIPVCIKFSIVHDVSLGLCYLHGQDQPIVHRDLSPNNVLLTAHHVAKISDLGVAKVVRTDNRKTLTKVPGTVDFKPPEAASSSPKYGTPMDVFSFAGIVLHTFNQCWPSPEDERKYDSLNRKMIALLETERRQKHLDKMTGPGKTLKPLVEQCLDCDPALRPKISIVCRRIQVTKDNYLEKPLENSSNEWVEEKALAVRQIKEEKINSGEKFESKIKMKDEQITELTQQISQLKEQLSHNQESSILLEERVIAAEEINKELNEEKSSSEEELRSIIEIKTKQICDLLQQKQELTEELASVQKTTATKMGQLTNTVQSLHAQIESKDKEIAALKQVITPHNVIQSQQHSSASKPLKVVPLPGISSSFKSHPLQGATVHKVCPMCQVKFPAQYSSSEFERHVQSHFDY